MEKSRKPKIRFKGYNDDWEQRKLGEIVSIIMGQSPDGSTYSNEPSDYILVQGNADLLNGWVLPRIWTTQITKKADAGDLIMSVRAPAGSMGKTAYDAVIGRGVAAIKGNEFIYQLLVKMDEEGYWKTFSCGSTFESLSSDTIKNAEVCITLSAEQMQIGLFLKQLDNLITLHQRKLDKLINVKKSMLEKMFPKQGSTVPEIRFSGFTNAWEQREFKELYSKSGEKNDGSIGINKNITVATMQFKDDVKVSTPEYLRTYYTFNLGDIAFEGHQSKDFRYGRFVENDIGNGIVSHIFSVFRPVQEYDLHFWKYAINNETLMQRILSRSTKASTMMHDLVTDDFLNETFLVPSLSEQEAIGSVLHKLDHLITLHQRKLEKLKNIKKSMLEKMFV